jgi:hypothetical protein
MHLLGFYIHVVFETLCIHLQIQYLSCKIKGFFSSGLKRNKLILESQSWICLERNKVKFAKKDIYV